jgi:hypothetical protein
MKNSIKILNSYKLAKINEDKEVKITILIPTRKRIKYLYDCLNNIYSTANKPNNIEVALKIDSDDSDTINEINNILKTYKQIKIVISNRNNGYLSLHEFFYDLVKICDDSVYFIQYNDDSKFLTKNWDSEIYKLNSKIGVFNCKDKQCFGTFPIVHRKIYEIIKKVSAYDHCDIYINKLARQCNIINTINIEVEHLTCNPKYINQSKSYENKIKEDALFNESREAYKHEDIKKVESILKSDIDKLNKYLKDNK